MLALTSLTVEEFEALLAPFEKAFQAHMAQRRFDGKPRTRRRYATYRNCPLPTPEDRLLFVLAYLKLNPLQEAHGAMFGMPQSKANPWLHTLLPALRQALIGLGDAPSRSLVDLAEKLDLTPEQAEQILAAYAEGDNPPESSSSTPDEQVAPPNGGPLFAMTEPIGASRAPRTGRSRSSTTAARESVTR
jgi:hypothetical protein